MIVDYASLKDTVSRWVARETDSVFTGEVETLIQLAEAQMQLDLEAREMICRGEAILNEEFEWLPTSFLEMHQVSLIKTDNQGKEARTLMMYKDLASFERYQANATGGDPDTYTVYAEQLRFAPPPSGEEDPALKFEIVFLGEFTPLSDTVLSNSILTKYPQIYLYGSLVQAEAFLINDERIPTWKRLYAEGINQANLKANRRRGPAAVSMPY